MLVAWPQLPAPTVVVSAPEPTTAAGNRRNEDQIGRSGGGRPIDNRGAAPGSLTRVLPQLLEAMAERLRLLGEHPHRDEHRTVRELRGTLVAGRRQARAPVGERLMHAGEPLEHFEVLALAEPAAQPLGFVGPHPAEARP